MQFSSIQWGQKRLKTIHSKATYDESVHGKNYRPKRRDEHSNAPNQGIETQ